MFIGNTFNIGINLSLGDMELGLDFINNSPDLLEGKNDSMENMEDGRECSDIDTDDRDGDGFDWEEDPEGTEEGETEEGRDGFDWEEDEPTEEGDGFDWEEDEPEEIAEPKEKEPDVKEEGGDNFDWEEEPGEEEGDSFEWEEEPEELDKPKEKEEPKGEDGDGFDWEEEPEESDFSFEDKTPTNEVGKPVIKETPQVEELSKKEADIKARELLLKERELALKEKELELRLRRLEVGNNTISKDTSSRNTSSNSNEINSITTEEKPAVVIDSESQRLALIRKYSVMSQDILYRYVKGFMLKNGVKSHPIDGKLLNNKFGADNINKLIKKSYLIKLNGNYITCNR